MISVANRARLVLHDLLPVATALVIAIAASLAGRGELEGQTILNTERFQLGEVSGPHLTANLSFTGRKGNSDILIADASGIAGIRLPTHWLRFIFGGTYLWADDRSLLDARFAQLRYSWMPSERVQTLHFVQAQQNESLRLRSRWLVGSGVQRDFYRAEQSSIAFGTGVMREWERLDEDAVDPGDPTERDTWRIANLGVVRVTLENDVAILNILYLQPSVEDFSDMRVLNDLGITVPIADGVRFTVSGEWRRDSRPPANLERDDLTLRMGISIDFR